MPEYRFENESGNVLHRISGSGKPETLCGAKAVMTRALDRDEGEWGMRSLCEDCERLAAE